MRNYFRYLVQDLRALAYENRSNSDVLKEICFELDNYRNTRSAKYLLLELKDLLENPASNQSTYQVNQTIDLEPEHKHYIMTVGRKIYKRPGNVEEMRYHPERFEATVVELLDGDNFMYLLNNQLHKGCESEDIGNTLFLNRVHVHLTPLRLPKEYQSIPRGYVYKYLSRHKRDFTLIQVKDNEQDYFTDFNDRVYALGTYHPQKISGTSQYNPKHDEYSKLILAFKDQYRYAIEYFIRHAEKSLKPIVKDGCVFCAVPSHAPGGYPIGFASMLKAYGIAENQNGLVCLDRHTEVYPSHLGGSRDVKKHLDSICAINQHIVSKKRVCLLDDITTTGNSLYACAQILMDAGASSVECIVLGKTAR